MLKKTHRSFATTFTAGAILTHQVYQNTIQVESWTDVHFDNPTGFAWLSILLLSYLLGPLADLDNYLPFFKHRGMTHSIFALIPLWLLVIVAYHSQNIINLTLALSLALSWTSHLVGDAYSVSGVEWLYPFRQYEVLEDGAMYKKGKRILFPKLYKVGVNELRWYKQGSFGLVASESMIFPAEITWLMFTLILLFISWKI